MRAPLPVSGGILGFVGWLMLAVTPAMSSPSPKKAKGKAAVAECKTDDECVLVIDGCCGCSEGGKQRGIPGKARDAYEKKRQHKCSQTMCPQMMSQDPSCEAARAVCKEGVCATGS